MQKSDIKMLLEVVQRASCFIFALNLQTKAVMGEFSVFP